MKVYDVKQLSTLLRITERAVTRLIRKGQIPAQKIGQKWYASEQALQEYLQGFRPEGIRREVSDQLRETAQKMLNFYKKLDDKESFKEARKAFDKLERKVNILLTEEEK
jgi:excisionase family DNA binding protein